MASIRERTTKNGDTTWQVMFRHNGKQPSRQFLYYQGAQEFKTLVERIGPDAALQVLEARTGNGARVPAEVVRLECPTCSAAGVECVHSPTIVVVVSCPHVVTADPPE